MPCFGTIFLLLASKSQSKLPAAHWRAYPIGKNFTVSLPYKPEITKDDIGKGIVLRSWNALGPDSDFSVNVSPLISKQFTFEKMATGTIRDSCQGNFDNLIAETEGTFNGWPEMAITFRSEDGSIDDLRFIETSQEDLTLDSSYDETAPARPADVSVFLKSVKATTHLGKGPLEHGGPVLKAYPLGDTGIFAKFPSPPKLDSLGSPFGEGNALVASPARNISFNPQKQGSDGPAGGTKVYFAGYFDRIFAVMTVHIPQALTKGKDFTQGLEEAIGGLFNSIHGKDLETNAEKIGNREAVYYKFRMPNGLRIQGLFLFDKDQIVGTIAGGPKIFLDSPQFKEFTSSLQFPN